MSGSGSQRQNRSICRGVFPVMREALELIDRPNAEQEIRDQYYQSRLQPIQRSRL